MSQLRLKRILSQLDLRFLALAFGLALTCQSMAAVVGDINQVGDTLHLEFKGSNNWQYNIQKKGSQIEIEVPRLSETTVESLRHFKGNDVQVEKVRHDGSAGSDLITLRIKGPELDYFDYLTDQPSRLMIDFFAKKTPNKSNEKQASSKKLELKELTGDTSATVSQAEGAADSPKADRKGLAINKLPPKLKAGRRDPATADYLAIADNAKTEVAKVSAKDTLSAKEGTGDVMNGIFDGGDPNFERFQMKDYEIKQEGQIASESRYYLEFPMLKEATGELEKIKTTQPLYEIAAKEDEENKQARLLLTLFENKRYYVFLKTVTWFFDKYPKSEYSEIIRFMWADTYFALWNQDHDQKDFDLAMLRYRQALEIYPSSILMERTMMLMGFASMDRGDYLGTLRLFQQHIAKRPHSPNRDIARLAIADNFTSIGRFDEAAKLYEEVEKEASQTKYQVTAAFLRGDVEYKRKQYQKSVELYEAALKKFPEFAKQFPNAYYNKAAALFHEKRNRESLTAFLEFLKLFPSHSHAAYAMTRVGELMDALGADKSKVVGAYLETYFRYGDSPGAVVARLRLLSSRMSTMKDKELEKAIADIGKLSASSGLPKADQFATLLISDGLASRKDFDPAIERLTNFYQQNPTTADLKLLNHKIVVDISEQIRDQGEAGHYLQALKTHEKYSDTWLKDTHRLDNKYQVARDFDKLGVPVQAHKLYKESLNSLLALKGTNEEKRILEEQHLPTVDSLYLSLATTSAALGKDAESYDYLRQLKQPELMSEEEQIQRVDLASKLLEKKGDLLSSQRYLSELVKVWKGQAKMVAKPYLRLGELEEKQGQAEEALRSYEKVDELMEDSGGQVKASIHEKALERIAEIHAGQKRMDKAILGYEKLLKNYESSVPLASFRYKLGKIYFDRGDLSKANEAWAPLQSSKNPVWYELASEQLKNANWNGDYKKYIQRIPAMSKNE